MSLLGNKKILLTGGAGFLGGYIKRELVARGVLEGDIIIPRSGTHDLRNPDVCAELTKNIDIVIHAAGTVGGIGFNRDHPAEAFYNNAIMAANLIEASRVNGVGKFVGIGSVCSYPKFASVPFKEENLWDGYPEETNASYGLAKKMMLVQSQAYAKQYGFNAIHLLMINLYGPEDNFNPASSHVIPALIRKVYEAKQNGKDFIDVWGTGKATREFLYVADAARGIVDAAEKYNEPDPVNLGSGREISIKDLIKIICEVVDFKGEIRWDATKPDGQLRRMLDTSKAKEKFGFVAETDFLNGLRKTIDWYKNQL